MPMPTPTLRRELTVIPRVLNEEEGTVEFTASDESLDSYDEVIRAAGWRFTYFAKNAPFVNSHDYSDIRNLLGQVIEWRVAGGALIETVRYARAPGTLAEWAFAMVRDGFLRAVSVGFRPVRSARRGEPEFAQAAADLRLAPADAARLRAIYLEHEQLELSQCIIGANPNALAKSCELIAQAHKRGTLDEQAVHSISELVATAKPTEAAAPRADAAEVSLRARAAFLAGVQRCL